MNKEQLNQIISINPPVFETPINEIANLLQTKRWYELGEKLLAVLSQNEITGNRLLLFNTIIKPYADMLDPFHYAKILLIVSSEASNPDQALEFLNEKLNTPFFEKNPEPKDLLNLEIVVLHTQKGNFEEALSLLNKVEKSITETTALIVRSRFHKTQADLDKARADFDAFYEHALLYLSTSGCKSDFVLAYDLCMAALFSNNVCSFGELASHEILNSLLKTKDEWLRDLIILLDRGDSSSIPEFDERYAPIILQSAAFAQFLPRIRQKLALAVFLQLIFSRPFETRIFSFDQVANECHLQKDNVELLVMKALSSGIIKGEIDEVEEKITVTWCKPKALGKDRLLHLQQQIQRWIENVHKHRIDLEQRAQQVVG